jgi:hypothetical protein
MRLWHSPDDFLKLNQCSLTGKLFHRMVAGERRLHNTRSFERQTPAAAAAATVVDQVTRQLPMLRLTVPAPYTGYITMYIIEIR